MTKYLWIAILLILFPTADAAVFKCKMANGQTQYQDKPCDDGKTTQGVYRDDRVSPEERAAAARVHQRTQAHANRLEAQNKPLQRYPSGTSYDSSNGTTASSNSQRSDPCDSLLHDPRRPWRYQRA